MKPRHDKPSRESMGLPPKPTIFNLFKKNATGHVPQHVHNHLEHSEPALDKESIHTIALVIDGQVYDVLRAQDKLADLLLAQPTFVLVTEETSVAKVNYKYIDGRFIADEPTT
jgi:hypothetical protein